MYKNVCYLNVAFEKQVFNTNAKSENVSIQQNAFI